MLRARLLQAPTPVVFLLVDGFHFIFMSFVHFIAPQRRFRLASQNGALTSVVRGERSAKTRRDLGIRVPIQRCTVQFQ